MRFPSSITFVLGIVGVIQHWNPPPVAAKSLESKSSSLLVPRFPVVGKTPNREIGLNAVSKNVIGDQHRQSQDVFKRNRALKENSPSCDSSFMTCLDNPKCLDCFTRLGEEGIDWASVTPDTPCLTVVDLLVKKGYCDASISKGGPTSDLFCKTFTSCVVWDEPLMDDDFNYGIDCNSLSSCEWEGIHKQFLGDGICHNDIPGCYNTKICGWDHGDCCDDTCHAKGSYSNCTTHSKFACKDPASANCNPELSNGCEPQKKNSTVPTCGNNTAIFRLKMYDSFGDGWDSTKITISGKGTSEKVYFGGLDNGAEGTEYICLSKSSSCYRVVLSGGAWGNEVSWEIRPYDFGPTIAGGGSPMDCTFPVAGNSCNKTCDGKPNKSSDSDSDYKSYKDMYNCLSTKCAIQAESCEKNSACIGCMTETPPDYCFANDQFNSLVNCALCQCSEDYKDFCDKKATPGVVPNNDKKSDSPVPCTPAETLKGSQAVLSFANCTNFDQVGVMVTDFNQNNFGELDSFEECAHSYHDNEVTHGGRTALSCMQILYNAINKPIVNKTDDKTPREAIAKLASYLYNDAEHFCSCTQSASELCPLCPSFVNFKTLLYESIDACNSLDFIDCDAWNEFYVPCKKNLEQTFSKIDFSNPTQCEYVRNTCGGAGPFPAFRRLDCEKELPKESWDFHNLFAKSCLDSGGKGPTPAVSPTAPSPLAPPAPKPAPSSGDVPTPKPYVPADTPKPYIPSDGTPKPYVTPSDAKTKKKSHFFRNFFFLLVIGGVGYYFYKRQADGFSFVRYRRNRNFLGGGGGGIGGESEMMYSSLRMDDSTSFEPASLPPTPSAMGSQMI